MFIISLLTGFNLLRSPDLLAEANNHLPRVNGCSQSRVRIRCFIFWQPGVPLPTISLCACLLAWKFKINYFNLYRYQRIHCICERRIQL